MREEYDINALNPRQNPYVQKRKKPDTINLTGRLLTTSKRNGAVMSTFNEFVQHQLQDPEFKKAYDSIAVLLGQDDHTEFHRVKSVTLLPEHKLHVQFIDGTIKRYDITPLCERYPAFHRLRDSPDLFAAVRVDAGGYGVSWADDIDIACDELWSNGFEDSTLSNSAPLMP